MSVEIEEPKKIISSLGLENGGKVHAFFTATCAKHMDKYVPFDTGTLAETVVLNNQIVPENVDVNSINYEQEYASYVYNGLSKNGNSLHYSDDKHPYAGDHWDEQMWSAEESDIEKEVQDYVDKFGGK